MKAMRGVLWIYKKAVNLISQNGNSRSLTIFNIVFINILISHSDWRPEAQMLSRHIFHLWIFEWNSFFIVPLIFS